MNTKYLKLLLITTFFTLLFSSCMKDSDLSPNDNMIAQAGFTMINAYTGSDYVVHKADNNFIQTMNNPLTYKAINFVYLYPGNRKIQTIDKENRILLDSTYAIKNAHLYTSIVFKKPGNKLGQHLVADSLLTNTASNSAIRFLNLAENKNNLDVYIGDTKVVSERDYDGNTTILNHFKFFSQNSGSTTVTIKDQEDNLLIERTINFAAGMHYTFILLNTSKENNYELLVHQQYRN